MNLRTPLIPFIRGDHCHLPFSSLPPKIILRSLEPLLMRCDNTDAPARAPAGPPIIPPKIAPTTLPSTLLPMSKSFIFPNAPPKRPCCISPLASLPPKMNALVFLPRSVFSNAPIAVPAIIAGIIAVGPPRIIPAVPNNQRLRLPLFLISSTASFASYIIS